MSRSGIVIQGSWINSKCIGSPQVAVCQKNLTNPCDSPATEAPPLTPFQCNEAFFYSGFGQARRE